MAIVVEHEKRRREILDKAIDVFSEEGYGDVTFQKIADRCGITRTTLYIYFKNKREIFIGSIRQITSEIETKIQAVIRDSGIPCGEKLRRTMEIILDSCAENHKLFYVILMYLMQLKKSGKNPSERVRRRTIRARHLLSTILIEGTQKGEFHITDIRAAGELLYSLIETAIFRLAVYGPPNSGRLLPSVNLTIDGFLARPPVLRQVV
jgi:AcrR family transcriptional regulator